MYCDVSDRGHSTADKGGEEKTGDGQTEQRTGRSGHDGE